MFGLHVKLKVFRPSNNGDGYATFACTSILFQRNMVELVKVDGYPFKIKVEFPVVDILYDNCAEDVLASINLQNFDGIASIEETTLNVAGKMFSAEVTLDTFLKEEE